MRWVSVVTAAMVMAGGVGAQVPKVPPKLTTAKVRTEDFVYKKTPQGELTLHGFFPTDWQSTDRRPVIVFFFGGGWKGGAYTQFVPQSEYFASRGLVAFAADYRIESKHKTTPDVAVEDAKSAIRWVRAHAEKLGVDPEKVIASGGSAGGHLAAATALVEKFDAPNDPRLSARPNALVLFNPFLDGTLGKSDRVFRGAQGQDITRDFSPSLYLASTTPPTVQFFGTEDRLLAHGKDYTAKAQKLGVRAELYLAEGQNHGFFNRPPWIEATTAQADAFLASLGYLKGPPTIKVPEGAVLRKAEAKDLALATP